MRVYIKDHPFAAGKWIYKGYKSGWESLGYEAILYTNLSDIEDKDYQIMAIDHDIRSKDHIQVLENDLSEILGMSIKILHNKSGKGTLKINYSNLDQFDMLLKKLKK